MARVSGRTALGYPAMFGAYRILLASLVAEGKISRPVILTGMATASRLPSRHAGVIG